MNYWLIGLPRERLEFCMKVGIFGLNRKYILGKVKEKDKILFYSTKERQILATGEITDEYYVDDQRVFTDKSLFPNNELFPDRIGFSVERLTQPVDFIPIIDQMSFIKSLANWQVHFRSAIVQIAKSDWDLISNEAQKIPAS